MLTTRSFHENACDDDIPELVSGVNYENVCDVANQHLPAIVDKDGTEQDAVPEPPHLITVRYKISRGSQQPKSTVICLNEDNDRCRVEIFENGEWEWF